MMWGPYGRKRHPYNMSHGQSGDDGECAGKNSKTNLPHVTVRRATLSERPQAILMQNLRDVPAALASRGKRQILPGRVVTGLVPPRVLQRSQGQLIPSG